jgi:hypothetical protein
MPRWGDAPLPSQLALHRQNTEISKQIFPEKEYRGLSPNFHIHASVSDLYISTIGLPILLEEICRPILGLQYINRSQTHECGNWGWGRAIPRKGIHKKDFRCSVGRNNYLPPSHFHFPFSLVPVPTLPPFHSRLYKGHELRQYGLLRGEVQKCLHKR